MRRLTVGLLIGLIAVLGLSDIGQAQPPAVVQVQGIIRAVDCQAQLLVLETGGRVNTFPVTASDGVFANGGSVPFCTLGQYLGTPATVSLGARNSELVVSRIDLQSAYVAPPSYVATPVAAPPPPPPVVVTPPPLAGVILGTILVGGLFYLLVQHPYGGPLYRYPYYGPYYRYYYRPTYRPYVGPYRYAPAYGWCPNQRWGWGCR